MADQADSTQRPERFVWPPRREPPAQAVQPPQPVQPDQAVLLPRAGLPQQTALEPGPGSSRLPSLPENGHRTPPNRPPPEKERGEEGSQVRVAGLRSIVRELEIVWLGRVTPPLTERMADAGWRPDRPGTWCRRCGATLGSKASIDGPVPCRKCEEARVPWERLIRLGEFGGVLRDVIHEVKYTRWRRLGTDLGQLLGKALLLEMEQEGVDPEQTVLVPVPTSFWRRIERGVDHPLVLARGVAKETGLPMCEVLSRRHRPTQQSLPASRRAENIRGSIMPRRWAKLEASTIVLVDDVTTTGTTLAAAAKALGQLVDAGRHGGVRSGPRVTSGGGGSRTTGGGGTVEGKPRRPRIWVAVAAVTPEPGEGAAAR
jgi:predicted amidophosphoribosyltransferase